MKKYLIATLAALMLVVGVTGAPKAENRPAPAAKPDTKPAKGGGQVILTSKGGSHDDGKGITRLFGSVVVIQEGEDFVLHADSVTYNREANQAVATGNLVVETKDSTITGLSLRADFDSKHIFIKDNVVMDSHGKDDGAKKDDGKKPAKQRPGDAVGDIAHKPSKMLCNSIDYNYDIKEALVTGNIRLKQEETSGTCRQITFDEENNIAELSGDVSFSDKKGQTFQVEKMTVWFDDGKMEFDGPVTVKGKNQDDEKASDPTKNPLPRQPKRDFGKPPVVPDLDKDTPDKPAKTN